MLRGGGSESLLYYPKILNGVLGLWEPSSPVMFVTLKNSKDPRSKLQASFEAEAAIVIRPQ